MSLLLRCWPYLVAAIVCAAAGASITYLIDQHRYDGLQAEFDDYKLRAAAVLAQADRDAQARLSAQADRIQEIELASDLKASEDERVIADLRTKFSRVRIATRAPSCPAVPEARDSSERPRAGGDERGSLEVDGEPFIQYAAATAAMKAQYLRCQAVVKTFQ
jgi:folate-binding Fe-S cluster repair protein YgfZ